MDGEDEQRRMIYAASDEMNEDELLSETAPDHFADRRKTDPKELTTRDEVPEESQVGIMSYMIDPDHERKLKNMRESRRRKLF